MCDAPSFYQESIVKARAGHKCCECRKQIATGEHYQAIRGVWDGQWGAFKTCARCVFLREMMSREGFKAWGHDYCFGLGDLKDEWWECFGAPLGEFEPPQNFQVAQ